MKPDTAGGFNSEGLKGVAPLVSQLHCLSRYRFLTVSLPTTPTDLVFLFFFLCFFSY